MIGSAGKRSWGGDRRGRLVDRDPVVDEDAGPRLAVENILVQQFRHGALGGDERSPQALGEVANARQARMRGQLLHRGGENFGQGVILDRCRAQVRQLGRSWPRAAPECLPGRLLPLPCFLRSICFWRPCEEVLLCAYLDGSNLFPGERKGSVPAGQKDRLRWE